MDDGGEEVVTARIPTTRIPTTRIPTRVLGGEATIAKRPGWMERADKEAMSQAMQGYGVTVAGGARVSGFLAEHGVVFKRASLLMGCVYGFFFLQRSEASPGRIRCKEAEAEELVCITSVSRA